MEPLPFVDEHSQALETPSETAWSRLIRIFGGGMPTMRLVARLLRCDPAGRSADFGSEPGQSVAGFRIAELEFGRRLQLRGRHRFANYQLTFLIEADRLIARTHAAFPGRLGRVYRAFVIDSGAHSLLTRHLLRRIVRVTPKDLDNA